MADNTRTTWAAFLFDLQGSVYELYPSEAVFLAEMSGFSRAANDGKGGIDRLAPVQRVTREMDGARDIFTGQQVRHSVILAGLTGGGFVDENGTWNVPHELQDDDITLKLVRSLFPFSLTVDVERDSMDNSTATAVATMVNQTRSAMARTNNIGLLGDGTSKVADITGGSSPGLTIQVGVAGNFDVLLPGTVWDVLTKSNIANPGAGLRRKIDSVANEGLSTATVTFSTNAVASDGNSGNITFSTNEGIYINGSASTAANAGTKTVQGLEQAAAVTGTFESIDKAAVSQWQGTDGRAGDTTTVPLSASLLGAAVRRGRRSGLGKWDFGLGDPAAIDIYKDSLLSLVRYKEETSVVASGFQGIIYDGADAPMPLIKEPAHKKGGVKLIDKASFQLYGDKVGPAFLDDDGAMFRRFSRSLAKEADMLDRWQMGVLKCNTIVFLNNLAVS